MLPVSCGYCREGFSQPQQQPHAIRSDLTPAVATAATAARGPNDQQTQALSLVTTTAAAEHAMTATTGPEPGALLEIIRRAEHLKIAMEQATSRGISLGLPCGLGGPASILAHPVSNRTGSVRSSAGLQLWAQQQLAWPRGHKPAPEVLRPWLPGTAAPVSAAADGTDAPGGIAASSTAIEAVQECLYGSPAAVNSPLALPRATEAASAALHAQLATLTAVPESGYVANSADTSTEQQQLSPLAAALLQWPAQVQNNREDPSSDDGDGASRTSSSSSSSTSSDGSQVTELEDLEELEELLLQVWMHMC